MNPMMIGAAAGGGLGFLDEILSGNQKRQDTLALRLAELKARAYNHNTDNTQVYKPNPLGALLEGAKNGAMLGGAYGNYMSAMKGPQPDIEPPNPAEASNEAPLVDPDDSPYGRFIGEQALSRSDHPAIFDPNNPYAAMKSGRVRY